MVFGAENLVCISARNSNFKCQVSILSISSFITSFSWHYHQHGSANDNAKAMNDDYVFKKIAEQFTSNKEGKGSQPTGSPVYSQEYPSYYLYN